MEGSVMHASMNKTKGGIEGLFLKRHIPIPLEDSHFLAPKLVHDPWG